ncbi:hypothetical protein BU16DRAFT_622289 [Lophium mytilinum]|uniref:Uncharacterized protein n=1 Tax=Lophium mytilinum TaxID=390894 RepID=A0A6A6QB66_9PEZI|nr:hypothetical protein BU16DRAFT_622289 [Lophium mytilinum]
MRLLHQILLSAFHTLFTTASPVDPDLPCYLPSGRLSPNTKPCLSTSGDGHSHCCDPAINACLDNGLCYVYTSGDTARESCTDSTWISTACPQYCREMGRELAYIDSGCGLVGKLFIGGQPMWCCQFYDGNCSTNGGPFPLTGGRVIPGWGPLAKDALAVSAAASTAVVTTTVVRDASATAAASETACVSGKGREKRSAMLAVGAGVGVPLVLSLGVVSVMLLSARRRVGEAAVMQKGDSGGSQETNDGLVGAVRPGRPGSANEMTVMGTHPVELDQEGMRMEMQ